MLYKINYSKYINEINSDYCTWSIVLANSEKEAIEKLIKIVKRFNYIISVTKINNDF